MAGRSQLSHCYKKLIVSIAKYVMFYFIKESSGYIQIRTLAAPDQNTNGIAIYTDTSINQTPASQAHSSKKKKKNHYTRSLL